MEYNKKQLLEEARKARFIEVYKYTGTNRRIHTDNVEYIGNGNLDISEIDALPFNKKGEVNADVQLMSRNDYESTILANSGLRWEDGLEEGDKILVIVI